MDLSPLIESMRLKVVDNFNYRWEICRKELAGPVNSGIVWHMFKYFTEMRVIVVYYLVLDLLTYKQIMKNGKMGGQRK